MLQQLPTKHVGSACRSSLQIGLHALETHHAVHEQDHRHIACRDLVDDDIDAGRSPALPQLSEEQWQLLLDCPAFSMATSMKYTQARRPSDHSSRRTTGTPGAAAKPLTTADPSLAHDTSDAQLATDTALLNAAGESALHEEGSVQSSDSEEDGDSSDTGCEVQERTGRSAASTTSDDTLAKQASNAGSMDAMKALRRATAGSFAGSVASQISLDSAEAAAVSDARALSHFAATADSAIAHASSSLRREVRSQAWCILIDVGHLACLHCLRVTRMDGQDSMQHAACVVHAGNQGALRASQHFASVAH